MICRPLSVKQVTIKGFHWVIFNNFFFPLNFKLLIVRKDLDSVLWGLCQLWWLWILFGQCSVRCEGWCVVVSDRGTGPWPDDILGAGQRSWDTGTGDDTSYLPGLLNSRREQLMEDGVRRTICLISLPSPWLISVFSNFDIIVHCTSNSAFSLLMLP